MKKSIKTKEELTKSFIARSKKRHGEKFDYSNIIYIDDETPVKIICPIHGEFEIKPSRHLYSKYGCPKCANIENSSHKKMTTEQFIEKAKKIWGDFFIYDKTYYDGMDKKLIITCPLHGDFLTRPSDFLHHHGCPKCKSNKTKIINKSLKLSNKEEFINKLELLYPNMFNYDKVIYIDSRTKVLLHSILCNEDFYVTPAQAIQGHFKQKYRGESRINYRKKLTTEAFIQRANFIYGNKYDYSKTIYIDSTTKLTVTCPKHGDFLVIPSDHISHRQGCPKCTQSIGENFITKVLNDSGIQFIPQYKININNSTRYIDFCVVLGKKLIFLEYNGKQHYEPVEIFGGEKNLYKTSKT